MQGPKRGAEAQPTHRGIHIVDLDVALLQRRHQAAPLAPLVRQPPLQQGPRGLIRPKGLERHTEALHILHGRKCYASGWRDGQRATLMAVGEMAVLPVLKRRPCPQTQSSPKVKAHLCQEAPLPEQPPACSLELLAQSNLRSRRRERRLLEPQALVLEPRHAALQGGDACHCVVALALGRLAVQAAAVGLGDRRSQALALFLVLLLHGARSSTVLGMAQHIHMSPFRLLHKLYTTCHQYSKARELTGTQHT